MTLSAETQRILKIALTNQAAVTDIATEVGKLTQITTPDAVAFGDATDLPSLILLANEIREKLNLSIGKLDATNLLPYLNLFNHAGFSLDEFTLSGVVTTPDIVATVADPTRPDATTSLSFYPTADQSGIYTTFLADNPPAALQASTWLQFVVDPSSYFQGYLTLVNSDTEYGYILLVIENVAGTARSWVLGRNDAIDFTVIDSGSLDAGTLGDPIGLKLQVTYGATYPYCKAWINLNAAGWTLVSDGDDTGGASLLNNVVDLIAVMHDTSVNDAADRVLIGSLAAELAY